MAQAQVRPWHQQRAQVPAAKRRMQLVAVVLATGSCSTMQAFPDGARYGTVQIALPEPAAAPAVLDQAAAPVLTGATALQANAALPLVGPGGAAAPAAILASASPIAQMRALDCLAQAIYYEARSESEAGQRAVAQVVLNRVKHPAWPNSVCGVVYQGPMRAGGGCQFTFTCDGSLRIAPRGPGWVQARRLAMEALAGSVFEPVGLSTFYHANYVMPAWAPRLHKTAVIGTHLFYRFPNASRAAFSHRYAGEEPIARPNPILVRYARGETAPTLPAWMAPPPADKPAPASPPANLVTDEPELPPILTVPEDIQVKPEFRSSGQWRSDAPAAITGR